MPPGDIDTFSLVSAKLVVAILAPGATLLRAVDDTLCRKRGLTLYGAGMHYDPLISSRPKALVSWGHDWVVLGLIIVHPFWAPTKVFALPIAARLCINRQGPTKGKKSKGKSSQAKTKIKAKADPDHRTRPELALELINLAAQWFPNDEIIVLGDTLLGVEASCLACPNTFNSSAESIPTGRSTSRHLPRPRRPQVGLARKAIDCRAWTRGPGRRASPGPDSTSTSSGCMRPWTSRRSKPSTIDRVGTDRRPSSWCATPKGSDRIRSSWRLSDNAPSL